MRPWVAVAVAAAAVAVLATPSVAQSLAEVAARTKKKDQGKKPAKVYTETDLRSGPAGSGSISAMEDPALAAPSPAPGVAAVAPAGEKPKSEDEVRAEKQTEWRERLAHAESEVARITDEINRAQTVLNDISGPLYGGTRTALINRVDEGKRQLALAQQSVLDIQEEGRRARFR